MGILMGALLEFMSVTTWTFILIGMGFLVLIALHIYTFWVIIKHIRRIIQAEKARLEIENRERRQIRRMIRNKADEEAWLRFLAGLDEDQE